MGGFSNVSFPPQLRIELLKLNRTNTPIALPCTPSAVNAEGVRRELSSDTSKFALRHLSESKQRILNSKP